MISFLWTHWALSGIGVTALIAFVGVGLLGGWALVLNRYVIGALVVLLACVAGGLWWESEKEMLREQGRQEVEEENKEKLRERRAAISEFVVSSSNRETALLDKLRIAESRLDAAQAERTSHVSKAADAACIVTRGFVFDHDAALPGASRHPGLPPGKALADKPASGVALSTVRNAIDWNYTQASKLQQRLELCEERRYAACVAWDEHFGTSSGCAR